VCQHPQDETESSRARLVERQKGVRGQTAKEGPGPLALEIARGEAAGGTQGMEPEVGHEDGMGGEADGSQQFGSQQLPVLQKRRHEELIGAAVAGVEGLHGVSDLAL